MIILFLRVFSLLRIRTIPVASECVIIACEFPHRRAYVQGLGRVGRNGEECERFRTHSLTEVINKAEQEELVGKILAATENLKKKKPKAPAKATHSKKEGTGSVQTTLTAMMNNNQSEN